VPDEQPNQNQKAKEMTKELMDSREEAMRDFELEVKEKQQLEQLKERIKAFSEESEEAMEALNEAITEVAAEGKLEKFKVLRIIWGDEVPHRYEIDSHGIFLRYKELKKTVPASVLKAAIERELNSDNINSAVLQYLEDYIDEPWAKEVVNKAIKQDPSSIMIGYKRLKNIVPDAEKLLREQVKLRPTSILFYRSEEIEGEDFEEEMLYEAAIAGAKSWPYGIFQDFEKICGRKYKGKEYAPEIAAIAVEHNPSAAFSFYRKYKDFPNSDEILRKAAIGETKERYYMRLFDYDNYERISGKPFEREVLLACAENNPQEVLANAEAFKDKDFANEIVRNATERIVEEKPEEALVYYKEGKEKESYVDGERQKTKTEGFGGLLSDEQKQEFFSALASKSADAPGAFIEYYDSLKDYVDDPIATLRTAVQNARETSPKSLIRGFSTYREALEGGAEEAETVFMEAVEKEPREAIYEFRRFEEFEPYAERALKAATAKQPESALYGFADYKNKPYAKDVFVQAGKKLPDRVLGYGDKHEEIEGLPFEEEALNELIAYTTEKYPWMIVTKQERLQSDYESAKKRDPENAKKSLLLELLNKDDLQQKIIDSARENEPFTFVKNNKYFEKVLSEAEMVEALFLALEKRPAQCVGYGGVDLSFLAERDPAATGTFLMKFANQYPYHFISNIFEKDVPGVPEYEQARVLALRLTELGDSLRFTMSHSERLEHTENVFRRLWQENYEKVQQDIEAFNKKHGTSIEFRGIRRDPNNSRSHESISYSLIFINTFANFKTKEVVSNVMPITFAIGFDEMRQAAEEDSVIELLENKLAEEQVEQKDDQEIWEKEYKRIEQEKYSNAIGEKTAVMLALATGDERPRDFPYILDMYENQGASIHAVHIERNKEFWEQKMEKTKTAEKTGKAPELKETTADSLVKELPIFLQQAIIDDKWEAIYHYMIHGKETGKAKTMERDLDGSEVAKAISTPFQNPHDGEDVRNGKALCSLIPIRIYAESCYAGTQRYSIMAELKRTGVDVKDLKIITSADDKVALWVGHSESIISENADWGDVAAREWTPFHYYLNYYYEMLEHMKSQGVKIEPPLGTRTHALHFADRMTDLDGKWYRGQEVEGFHYSTEQSIEGNWLSMLEKLEDRELVA